MDKSMSEENTLSFSDLNLAPSILKVVNELGYETPTPIQQQSIPSLLAGRDVLGQAQTGTGKTAAFALPLLSQIDTNKQHPQLLILTPTRELALQVAEAIQTYSRHLKGCHVLPVYGGQNMAQQLRQLKRGVQVIVGTPGRIKDHLQRGTLKLNNIKATVIDEADEMLRMGFIADVEEILSAAPEDRQSALFSATMPKEILGVARKHLKNPIEIRIKSKTSTVEKISQRYWQVKGMHKLDALTRILEAEEFDGMLIFVRTKIATVELSEKLEARGFSSSALNGDMTQQLREKTIDRLKSGSLDIVVATDVVARGLDVQRISHVVNYDIPYDTESYVHRIGRTGRAGREGNAILFVAPREKRMLAAIERATKQPIKAMSLPSRSDITNRRVSQFKEQVAEMLESQDLEFFEELIDGIQSDYDIGHRRIAAAMAYLLQKDRPLQIDESEMKDVPVFREERSQPARQRSNDGLKTYRVEVGRAHGVIPGNLVGALSNEGQIDSRSIGRINIFDRFSLIDLPADLSQDQLHKLRKINVCEEQLQISLDSGGQSYSKPAGANRAGENRKKPFKKDWTNKNRKKPTRRD
jgi:ATP-dependent RNA helicase DeaD